MVALLKMPRIDREESWTNRRMFDRAPCQGTAQGHRLDHTLCARRNPRLNLALRDLSLGGVGAVCDYPVTEGESMTVTFPRRGLAPAWNATGRVLRCQPSPSGYQLAIEFEPLLAA